MTTAKISVKRLREIIAEEARASASINEFVDHKGISDIVAVASKLMAALEAFKEKAPPAAINAVTPHILSIETALENMVSSPGSYVPEPRKEPRHVSLKPVKS